MPTILAMPAIFAIPAGKRSAESLQSEAWPARTEGLLIRGVD